MTSTVIEHKQRTLEVIIVGAGVAGLTAAYALLRNSSSRVKLRVLEKRTESQCLEAGYPIHLTPAARASLQKLLSPSDWEALGSARGSLPTRHDGLLVMNEKEKRVWHTIREPGTACMVERGALLDILGSGAGKVEYDCRVISACPLDGGVEVGLEDGRILHTNLLIAADGMFSPIRRSLNSPDGLQETRWTTINFRASPSILPFLRDPHGLNVIYGRGWSAVLTPLPQGAYVALTVPSPVSSPQESIRKLPPSPFLLHILTDPGLEEARYFPLYSALQTMPGRGRIVAIGDAAHAMTPFAGSGASAAIHDAYLLVRTIKEATDLDRGLKEFNKALVKRNDPLVKLSKIVMELAQGKTRWIRAKRAIAFRLLDLVEGALPYRARKEAELCRLLAEESIVTKRSSVSTSADS